ncbi:MAG: NUDIX domain-containing protein [Clostridia bacterium]|nr:NUDIX domain-containing protein [Clostridia bacterium]
MGKPIEGISYYDRIGAYLICIENNKLAVVRDPKGYFLPGGGIDDGESLEECVKRECLEETGFLYVLTGISAVLKPTYYIQMLAIFIQFSIITAEG